MNIPEPRPNEDQIQALMKSLNGSIPTPDPAYLNRLREQSTQIFLESQKASTSPQSRKRIMFISSFKWTASGLAALLVIGLVVARWVVPLFPTDPPAPEDKFVLGEKLIDDGRIGKITDSQGLVTVKPVQQERWSPVTPHLVLKPGDLVRTDARGANAASVRLINSSGLIVGPHSTVELVKPTEIRLSSGELELIPAANAPIELVGPDLQKVSVATKKIFRIEKEKLVAVEQEPLWLQGFKGITANESIGSLIANLDGRSTPLTVGYHHVQVDIRDQIARTTIEESFVNHTPGVLEGVFYFPLPADASISGFGMWIGDKLVEADIVEKERAREIYETILREKRDPGLLEWAGGNMFKARVFPINASSEKRIKITYTQVLPLQGNKYRYSYGLQSELLKQHPLRELKIDVQLHSALPIKNISSPTHLSRIAKTEHSGKVEFTAQEYTPTRDFEAVVELEGRQSEVVVIPHRRGDDGYFMVQLMPPGSDGIWERPLIPNSEPLRLLILADTSASLDKNQRAAQKTFIASLASALTEKDFINFATCDVNTNWLFDNPQPATATNIALIQNTLAKRKSLGWTDLDRAFGSALTQTDAKTHVIYIGDAVPTTIDADPIAFAKRLNQIASNKPGTFHAVTVGNSTEPAVLKAIASIGGGSIRRISSEHGPQISALELLREIASPGIRDLKVEFQGIRTARVYPEEIPNLPSGSQQILLGRYLPEGKDQAGELIVTGKLGGKPVRYTTKISLRDAEAGNSFIPRLWARMHLDKLLEQGSSESIKQEIIALSEEFQIITPYTSLLVLESDTDRARFAVKRRFQMRDGEKFFALGQDNSSFELKQKQMRLAGDYRIQLRKQVLSRLLGLGRVNNVIPNRELMIRNPRAWAMEGAPESDSRTPEEIIEIAGLIDDKKQDAIYGEEFGMKLPSLLGGGEKDLKEIESPALGLDATDLTPSPSKSESEIDSTEFEEPRDKLAPLSEPVSENLFLGKRLQRSMPAGRTGFGGRLTDLSILNLMYDRRRLQFPTPPRPIWLDSLFPQVIARTSEPRVIKSHWSKEAIELSQSLSRLEKIRTLAGGVQVTAQIDNFDTDSNELKERSHEMTLLSGNAWLTSLQPDGGPGIISWSDEKVTGLYHTAFQLGRTRASAKSDLLYPQVRFHDYSNGLLHIVNSNQLATVEKINAERSVLILKIPNSKDSEVRYIIDTSRHVVLSVEYRAKEKITSSIQIGDFIEVGGQWWARKIETINEKGVVVSRVTLQVAELAKPNFAQKMKDELRLIERGIFLPRKLPSVQEAKAAVQEGKATLIERAVLTIHFASSQRWAIAQEQLSEFEKLTATKPGLRFLVNSFLMASRQHEPLKNRLLEDARNLVNSQDPKVQANAYFLAEHNYSQANQILEANELIQVEAMVKELYYRQPAQLKAPILWRTREINLIKLTGQLTRALELSRQLTLEYPKEYQVQHEHVKNLIEADDFEAADKWLQKILVPAANWNKRQETDLHDLLFQFLKQRGRYRDLATNLAGWLKNDSESYSHYALYLQSLVRSNQVKEAKDKVVLWLNEGEANGELTPAARARLEAAIQFACSQMVDIYLSRFDESWVPALEKSARQLSRFDDRLQFVSTIFNSRFNSTEAALALRKEFASKLFQDAETMSITRIEHLVRWVSPELSNYEAQLKKLLETLTRRWTSEKNPELKHRIGEVILSLLSREAGDRDLEFVRREYREGPEQYRLLYAEKLFALLLAHSWTDAIEKECFILLDKLTESDEPEQKLASYVSHLLQLTSAMLKSREGALKKTLEHPERLTRTELQKKNLEFLRLAREGYSNRLNEESQKAAPPFALWLRAERHWLDILLERNLEQVAEECWKDFRQSLPHANLDEEESLNLRLARALQQRNLIMLENLATRKGAKPEPGERLLQYFDLQMKDHKEVERWRAEKYLLLIGLDRTKDLEKDLTAWIRDTAANGVWVVALGYLRAEQGNVSEAIKLFEQIRDTGDLGPADYQTLANYYLVENKKLESDQAKVAVYKTMEEYQLSQIIYVQLRPWQYANGNLPTHLDPEVLYIFRALFEKSATPQNYLSQLQAFYSACRDFRLLQMLPDAVLGHTAGEVHPFLQGMRSVLGEIRDEAVVDEIVQRIQIVRKDAKTPVDRRALDILELLIEIRAAALQNQAGPHIDKAYEALSRAFQREWTPGEPRLMASLLASLGQLSPEKLRHEQFRQLNELLANAKIGSSDRLHIAYSLSQVQADFPRTADLLQAALKEFAEANGGRLPVEANPIISSYISNLERLKHHTQAETWIQTQLEKPASQDQKNWFRFALIDLYNHALRYKSEVALGSGEKLFQAIQLRIFNELKEPDLNFQSEMIQKVGETFSAAHDTHLPSVKQALRDFVSRKLLPLLKDQYDSYPNLLPRMCELVHTINGPKDALELMINSLENEPAWIAYSNQDSWNMNIYRISQWREEAQTLGELEPRLLKLVLKELRQDLRSHSSRNRTIYDIRYGYFWTEKASDFVKMAEEIYGEQKNSSNGVEYVADYLFHGVRSYPRAIEMLYDARSRKVLAESGLAKLAEYLQQQQRFAESIDILLPLVEKRPDYLDYYVRLMHAYYRTNKPAELRVWLKKTDELFLQDKKRTNNEGARQSILSALASSTLENHLYVESVAYFEELIPSYQRSARRRGIGDGTLSKYYADEANAYAGLGKTKEAIDRASAAIVSWGSRIDQRKSALDQLVNVIVTSPNLEAYIAELDKEKLQSPIVRKAIGLAYILKNDFTRAIVQLQQAAELQPQDAEIYQSLLTCYDKINDKEGAIQQLLQAVEVSRRDLSLFQKLGDRFAELRESAEAERAYTSIVEMQPNESECHTLLAEIREKQDRWTEAIEHWQKVAKLRSLEPTGLLKLANAQIHEKAWSAATQTLQKIRSQSWPDRFNNVQVQAQAQALERLIPQPKDK
ncbi:hypothetical protein KIH39_09760 [Telmatocola sphagniphila]|uniref:VIT domain-containing protein n=1 Tax=Telmatocola sphagniphila TaxID=1123043 RepID=A0A8E6B9F5_9BACT|nr:VIT and VWA domain-containing protein [Telmatocola sphagniphila]QVL34171.1 hypothetical protein KIH39_09760 [Telmatocola sphagniphila]